MFQEFMYRMIDVLVLDMDDPNFQLAFREVIDFLVKDEPANEMARREASDRFEELIMHARGMYGPMIQELRNEFPS